MSELKLEFEGTVLRKSDVITFDKSDFYKRELVVKTSGEYPQELKVEIVKGNSDKLNNVNEGSEVKVYADVRGNAFNDRWFVNLTGWKVDVLSAVEATKPEPAMSMDSDIGGDDNDEIPF